MHILDRRDENSRPAHNYHVTDHRYPPNETTPAHKDPNPHYRSTTCPRPESCASRRAAGQMGTQYRCLLLQKRKMLHFKEPPRGHHNECRIPRVIVSEDLDERSLLVQIGRQTRRVANGQLSKIDMENGRTGRTMTSAFSEKSTFGRILLKSRVLFAPASGLCPPRPKYVTPLLPTLPDCYVWILEECSPSSWTLF